MRLEQSVCRIDGGAVACWDAAHELEAGRIEPSQYLPEAMLGFVRVFVLIEKPCAPARGIEFRRSQPRVKDSEPVAEHAQQQAARVGGKPPQNVIQADCDEAPGAHQAGDGSKSGPGVAGVV